MSKLFAISKRLQRAAFAGVLFASLMKIMHWKLGNELFLFAILLLVLASLVNFLTNPSRSYGHWAGAVSLVAFGLLYFRIEALEFAETYLMIIAGAGVLLWQWDVGMDDGLMGNFLPFAPNQSILSRVLWISSTITIVIGALFKIMHWEYGNVLLIVGMAAAAIATVLPYIMRNEG
jgi:hypothetical protein